MLNLCSAVSGVSEMEDSVKDDEAMIDEECLAARLQVSKRTLQDMRVRREGIPFVKVGRLVRYRVADVERYLAERRVETASRIVTPTPNGGLGQLLERIERRTPVAGVNIEAPPSSGSRERGQS
jgi:excisionase family DNA binding protein